MRPGLAQDAAPGSLKRPRGAGADVNAGGGGIASVGVAAGDGAGVVATSGVTAGGCRTTPRRGMAAAAGVRGGGGGMRSLPAAGVTAAVWEPAVGLGVGAIAA